MSQRLSFNASNIPQSVQASGNACLDRLISKLPEEKNTMNTCIGAGVTILLLLMSVFNVLSIITNPGYFTTLFSLTMVAAIFTMC